MAVTEDVIQLRHPNNRFGKYVQYLQSEMRALAKMRFHGHIADEYNNPDIKLLMRDCISLERFGLADHAALYINGDYKGWAWCVTEEGKTLLEGRRPQFYGCRCEHAIKISCVCSESTFCPNPEHTGNGCHGTHD